MPGPRIRTGDSFEDVGVGLYQYLSTNGDGTGTDDAVGNYTTPTEFYIQDTTQYLLLERMIVYVEDFGRMDSGAYGNAITLTNGIRLEVQESDGTLVRDLMATRPIEHNTDWQGKCHDLTPSGWGSGNEAYSVRWTFGKSKKSLILAPGQKLVLILEDNFTGLEHHLFQIQGKYL